MRSLVAMLVVTALVAAACGGSAETEGGDTGAGSTTNTPEADDDSSVTTNGGEQFDESTEGDSVAGVGEATVVLDGETYRFADSDFVGQRCSPDLFGIFAVQLKLVDAAGEVDAGGSELFLTLLGDDADPVFVESGDERNRIELTFYEQEGDIRERQEVWTADDGSTAMERGDIEPGTSQVDDYTIEGNTASGTATFYEQLSWAEYFAGNADSYKVAQGTFEVTCAG